MSPAEVLTRLDERFQLLTAGRRTVLERHQTLRGAIDWSYALLDPAEQLLFTRLCVFAGGFTVAGAEHVATDDDLVLPASVLTLLGSLVAKSMVVTDDTGAGTRYRLLETLREYGWARLAEVDDPERLQASHAAHVLQLVESSVSLLKGADDQIGTAVLFAEQDNLRAALAWSRDHDTDIFVKLVHSTATFWQLVGNFREMSQWTRAAMDHASTVSPGSRAELLAFAGVGANYTDRFADAISWYEQSIRCSEEAGLTPVPIAVASLGIAELESNRSDEAVRQCAAAVEAARADGDEFWELFTLGNLVLACGLGTEREPRPRPVRRARETRQRLGNQWLLGTALNNAGIIRALDAPDEAITLLTESERLLTTSSVAAQARFFHGIALLRLGRSAEGSAMLRSSLPLMKVTGSDYFVSTVVGTCAAVIAARDATDSRTSVGRSRALPAGVGHRGHRARPRDAATNPRATGARDGSSRARRRLAVGYRAVDGRGGGPRVHRAREAAPMTDLPTGTVTFLFTDLEASTRLWEEHPEAMKAALARHDEILREAVETNDGYVVKTTGDGVHAVFADAAHGVAAAVDAQRALSDASWALPEPLRIRMGLHTGAAELRADDYYGPAVNRAARIMSAAHGGQVLVSLATEEVLSEALPPGVELVDLGEHRLRDLARRQRIFQVAHAGTPLRLLADPIGRRVPGQPPRAGHVLRRAHR